MNEPPEGDLRVALLAERAAVVARLERLGAEVAGFVEASRDTNADDEHDPEGATIAFERSQVASVERAARRRLAEVEAALARLEQAGGEGEGAVVTCTRCGRPIPAERLAARPWATTCVGCA